MSYFRSLEWSAESRQVMTTDQLNWLLEGYDIWTQPHRMLKFQHVS